MCQSRNMKRPMDQQCYTVGIFPSVPRRESKHRHGRGKPERRPTKQSEQSARIPCVHVVSDMGLKKSSPSTTETQQFLNNSSMSHAVTYTQSEQPPTPTLALQNDPHCDIHRQPTMLQRDEVAAFARRFAAGSSARNSSSVAANALLSSFR
jgi:hypothetical protein